MNEDFIEASRKFVCIRIETYESEESEEIVRSLLNGRFANTSFCVLDPQGRQRLSRSGRSPGSLVGRDGQEPHDEDVIREMNRIAARYKSTGDSSGNDQEMVLQDFDSFRQALNVASADQRLLVLVTADDEQLRDNLRSVLAQEDITGRFHTDIVDPEVDSNWSEVIEGDVDKEGIVIIRSGQFGLDGQAIGQLQVTASADEIRDSLINCNQQFAAVEERKDYAQHAAEGRRLGIYFENEVPYGEDRDGDGEIDNQFGGERQGQRGQRGQRGQQNQQPRPRGRRGGSG